MFRPILAEANSSKTFGRPGEKSMSSDQWISSLAQVNKCPLVVAFVWEIPPLKQALGLEKLGNASPSKRSLKFILYKGNHLLWISKREVEVQGHAMMLYLVCAHCNTWPRTENGECQAGGDPRQITQKCAFLSPWVSHMVVPLGQTDTNRLKRETREWRHWVN